MFWIASRATGYYYVSGKKSGIRETDEKRAGYGILAKKGRECGIRTLRPPFQTLNYVPLLFDRTHEREVKLELLTLSVCNVSLMETESSVWIHYGCLISINLAFSKVPLDPIWSTCKRDNLTCNNWKATQQFYARLGCVSSCVILTLCAPIST